MFARGTSGEFVLISEYRLDSRTTESIHCLAVVLLSDFAIILIFCCLLSPAESAINSVCGPEIFALDVARQNGTIPMSENLRAIRAVEGDE